MNKGIAYKYKPIKLVQEGAGFYWCKLFFILFYQARYLFILEAAQFELT
jgi:hypothetical protein